MAADGHGIGDAFSVGGVRVTVTPADHAWQNAASRPGQRIFQMAKDSSDFPPVQRRPRHTPGLRGQSQAHPCTRTG